MIKYCLRKWEENKEKLEKALLKDKNLNNGDGVTLQGIQDHGKNKITKDQIKPYNRWWREETEFLPVEENNG